MSSGKAVDCVRPENVVVPATDDAGEEVCTAAGIAGPGAGAGVGVGVGVGVGAGVGFIAV
jgi:hypothetical protein